MAILPSIIVGACMWVFSNKMDKREKKQEQIAKARKRETMLALEMQMATSKLSYATAIAVKRGYANGEVEEGVEAYEEAKSNYFKFLNEQATEHLAI